MDPVFRFYAGPNREQSGSGRGNNASRSIPVYEGYGFLSSLANRLLFPVLRNAGRDLLEQGLSYLGDQTSQKGQKRGAGFDYGLEGANGLPMSPPKRRKRGSRTRKKIAAISKRGGGTGGRRSRAKKQAGRGAPTKRRRRIKRQKKRGKASATKNLFHLFNKK